jgi:hypothetical protein
MRTNRQLRREKKRFDQKNSRQIDWIKVKKAGKTLIFICLLFFAIIFSLTYYAVESDNKIRSALSVNSTIGTGKVISVNSGKGIHSATYEFEYNLIKYTGSTFTTYKGKIGDNICVEFSLKKPGINISCDDLGKENWYDDSFLLSLKILGIMVAFCILFIIWKILTGDRKIIAELTSRSR